MKLIRHAASQLTFRRRKFALGLLVALAGSGGLAARAWQDGPASAGGGSESPRFFAPAVVGQVQSQQAGSNFQPADTQWRGAASATAQRFPSVSPRVVNSGRTTWGYSLAPYFPSSQSPEAAKIDKKIRELLGKLRSDPGDQSEIEQELQNLVAQQFDMRHAAHTKQIDALKASLEETQQALTQRAENREQIIERRAQQLLGRADPLGWDYQLRTGLPLRTDRSLPSTPAYPGVPYYAPVGPSSQSVPRAMPAQPPGSITPPTATSLGNVQVGRRLPGAISGEGSSDALVLQAQLNDMKNKLKVAKEVQKKGLVSSEELAEVESQIRILEAKLKGKYQTLRLELESARIDLEAGKSELELLMDESRGLKESAPQAYGVRRQLARSKANLLKAELQLEQKMQQLNQISKIVEMAESQGAEQEKADDSKNTSDSSL
ncbi:MAG: hypothetical protein Aurels2KO_00820 [Aureliella sp.]